MRPAIALLAAFALSGCAGWTSAKPAVGIGASIVSQIAATRLGAECGKVDDPAIRAACEAGSQCLALMGAKVGGALVRPTAPASQAAIRP